MPLDLLFLSLFLLLFLLLFIRPKCVKRNRLDKNREKFSHKRKTRSSFQKLEFKASFFRPGPFREGGQLRDDLGPSRGSFGKGAFIRQKCVKRNRLDKNREKFSHDTKTRSNFQKLEFKASFFRPGPFREGGQARAGQAELQK